VGVVALRRGHGPGPGLTSRWASNATRLSRRRRDLFPQTALDHSGLLGAAYSHLWSAQRILRGSEPQGPLFGTAVLDTPRRARRMGKAEPVHPDGPEHWSSRKAFRTTAPCREINKAKRAHQMAMGTRRAIYPPRPSRFGNPPGMTAALESSLPGACFAHPTKCQHDRYSAPRSSSAPRIRHSPGWRLHWPWRRRRACGCCPRRRAGSAPRHSRSPCSVSLPPPPSPARPPGPACPR